VGKSNNARFFFLFVGYIDIISSCVTSCRPLCTGHYGSPGARFRCCKILGRRTRRGEASSRHNDLVSASIEAMQDVLELFGGLCVSQSVVSLVYLQTVPPHMWLLLVQVGVKSGAVVVGVLTVSLGSEAAGSADNNDDAIAASAVGLLVNSRWDLNNSESVGITEEADASSRVSNVGAAPSGATTSVEVTVGRGGRVLPEGSTVRMVVLLIVGPGGVTVTTRVVGVWVLVIDSLVDAVPMFLMMSASSDTPALKDWLEELLEVEDDVVLVDVLIDVLKVVVSTTEA
jgi:hypothetical protein